MASVRKTTLIGTVQTEPTHPRPRLLVVVPDLQHELGSPKSLVYLVVPCPAGAPEARTLSMVHHNSALPPVSPSQYGPQLFPNRKERPWGAPSCMTFRRYRSLHAPRSRSGEAQRRVLKPALSPLLFFSFLSSYNSLLPLCCPFTMHHPTSTQSAVS